MNLRDLTYILAVERYGSITRAAEACDVTQPTLSAQIAKLERELGIRIFERDGRGLRITDAGYTVLQHAKKVAGSVDDLRAAVQAHLDPLAGVLRLGLIPTLSPYLLPALLPQIKERLPRITLAVIEEQTAALVERVHSGTLDAAMIATDIDDPHIVSTPLFDEPLLVALSAQHPLAKRKAIEPREIDPSSLLLLAEGHCLRDQALALCKDVTSGAPGDFRAASLETILNLVEAGLGLTIVPELCLTSARARREGLEVRTFAPKGASRSISLVYRRSTTRSAVLKEVAQLTGHVWRKRQNQNVRKRFA